MDMQIYSLHVIPVVIIVYGLFVLFMHPPVKVIAATLLGGLVSPVLRHPPLLPACIGRVHDRSHDSVLSPWTVRPRRGRYT